MARKVLYVAVNGVTGRMGYRQHLVRSLLSIREQGGVPLAGRLGRVPRAGPGRAQRDAAARDRRAARPGALVDPPGRRAGRPGGRGLLRHPGDQRARGQPGPGHRGRQARLHREAGGRLAGRGAAAGPRGARGRGHQRRRAGQAVPAGRDQAAAAGPVGLLRPGAVGAAGVRLLGVRGQRDPRAAAVLELPRTGRRRDRAGHVPALAVPAGGPVRPGHRGVRAAGAAHPAALGRVGGALRRHRRRRGLRACWSSPAG